jgi:putative hydrolase
MIDGDRLVRQDMQVHSTFSDGRDTIEVNVAEAERVGLVAMTCVDHVRRSTDWVPDYVAAVARVGAATPIELRCGVEAKLLDTSGRLDLPDELDGVDAIYAADHQVPLADGPHDPAEVRAEIEAGRRAASDVLAAIVDATEAAVRRHERVVVCHLFSVLPKLGLDEADVPLVSIERLADAAVAAGAKIEIDERWSCPSARTIRPFLDRGVPLMLSTDSHRSDTIGRYDYALEVLRELAASS